jgi:hypothetical protein
MPPFWPFRFHHNHHDHHRHHHDHEDETSSAASSTRSKSSCIVTEPSKRRRTQSSVSFFPHATQFEHFHLSEYTEEEKSNTWYSRRELRDIQEDNHETIQWMVNGCRSSSSSSSNMMSDDEEEFCSRGMEYKTPVGMRMRMRHRFESKEACLRYQISEWNHGRDACPERLAALYGRYTQNSAHVARLAAKMDRESLQLVAGGWSKKDSSSSTTSSSSSSSSSSTSSSTTTCSGVPKPTTSPAAAA